MSELNEYYFPGGDGKWDDAPLPDTIEEAHERIKVLEQALRFYGDIRSYNQSSRDNEYPDHAELMRDRGLTARIGRLATDLAQFGEWVGWASHQDRWF